jgi:hypothetical protein
MIKLVFVIRRREGLPPEEFHRYWLEEHGPLARSLLESLGARRYVQTHTLGADPNAGLATSRGTAEAYDGLARSGGTRSTLSSRRPPQRRDSAQTRRRRGEVHWSDRRSS